MLFEIVREDEIFVYQDYPSFLKLKQGFLTDYRYENNMSMNVYSIDENFNRIKLVKKIQPLTDSEIRKYEDEVINEINSIAIKKLFNVPRYEGDENETE